MSTTRRGSSAVGWRIGVGDGGTVWTRGEIGGGGGVVTGAVDGGVVGLVVEVVGAVELGADAALVLEARVVAGATVAGAAPTGANGAVVTTASLVRPAHDDDGGGQDRRAGHGEWDGETGAERPPADGPLDQVVRGDGQGERHREPHRGQRPAGQASAVRCQPDEDGPVPEVEPVGDEADGHDGPPRQPSGHRGGRPPGDGRDDDRHQQRVHGEAPAVQQRSGGAVSGDPHRQEAGGGQPGQDRQGSRPRSGRSPIPVPERDRHDGADEDRTDAAVGAEVRPLDVGAREPGHEHCGDDGCAGGHESQGAGVAPQPTEDQDDHEGPEQVELLLDGQAPQVLEWRRER